MTEDCKESGGRIFPFFLQNCRGTVKGNEAMIMIDSDLATSNRSMENAQSHVTY